jgi:DNA-binding CsgD family transcriptional regulator
MDLTVLVGAVEVLMCPLEWGSRDAWLAESVQRVREVRGVPGLDRPADAIDTLEALLHVPNDQPGWLRAALEGPETGHGGAHLPDMVDGSEALLVVISLRCALVAGLATLHRLRAWRSTLGQAFDDVETGMAIYGKDGRREVARNERLDDLLQEELARDLLLDHINRQAAQAASSERQREDALELELPGGFYRLAASRAAAGTLLTEPGVLVLVDRLTAALPTTQELRVTFGLRGREPQVALLAAEGLSNAVIAQRLRLSAHTVRHYLERVLDRLGLHTRKALALHLMGAGERPQQLGRRPAP